jgi:hypothetical protein
MRRLTGIILAAGALAFPAVAPAANTAQVADRIMREATARMTHTGPGELAWDDLPVAELLAKYDRGERLYIRCGKQSYVSQALLWRAGIHSRIVNPMRAKGAWDYSGDGHTFIDVWIGKRWVAYDPDGNRQPVDARGRAISAVRAIYSRPFHWRYTASDTYDETYPDYTYEELDRAADAALGIPMLQISTRSDGMIDQMAYPGTAYNTARLQGYGLLPPTYLPVGRRHWKQIVYGDPTAGKITTTRR